MKKEKVNKKIFIASLIAYFMISACFFMLKQTGILSSKHQWLIALYASVVSIIAYIWVLFIAKLIIDKLLKFQIEIGNDAYPFIAAIIKNKSLIHLAYCGVFFVGISMGLYGIWFNAL